MSKWVVNKIGHSKKSKTGAQKWAQKWTQKWPPDNTIKTRTGVLARPQAISAGSKGSILWTLCLCGYLRPMRASMVPKNASPASMPFFHGSCNSGC